MSGCQQNMEARNWLGERVSKACGKPAVALRYGVTGPSPYAVCAGHVYGRMAPLGLWGMFRARLAREVWAAKYYRP